MNKLRIYEFSPLFLTLDRVGPFQESLYEVDFTDSNDEPCNLYLLVSANGFGKTTILDSIAAAIGLLSKNKPETYQLDDLDYGNGRIQLDISVRYYWQGENHRSILSVIAGQLGQDISLKIWGENKLKQFEAESWHRLGYVGKPLKPLSTHRSDLFVEELLGTLQLHTELQADGFNESSITAPTVLHFSAYRDIPYLKVLPTSQVIAAPEYWNYQSAYYFSAHHETWKYSLDNLLVWLKWLDDGRFEKARDLLNSKVFSGGNKYFEDIQRNPPQAIININGQNHRLDRLSSGEKSLTQIFLRIGAHMTQNTIVLIDEFDAHLHIRWQYRLLNALKKLAASKEANITVIITTHSTEILDTYVNQLNIIEEDGRLRKGGHFIQKDMK